MDRAPPPHERTPPHGGVTLYTPESLRQWRLARQQKKQQLTASQRDITRENGEETVSPSAAAHMAGQVDVTTARTSDLRRRTETRDPHPDHERVDLLARQPTRALQHRHVPYARASGAMAPLTRRPPDLLTNPSSSGGTKAYPVRLTGPTARTSTMAADPSFGVRDPPEYPLAVTAAASGEDEITHGFALNEETLDPDTRTSLQTTTPRRLSHRLDDFIVVPLESETAQSLDAQAVGTCRVGWCTQPPKRHGLCWTHGGEKKCCRVDCGRAATDGEFCALHHGQLARK